MTNPDIMATWAASHTLRWHAQSCHALQRSGDTVAAHSGRMALLAHALWPDDAALVIACLHHDLPEFKVGDTPGPAKRRFGTLNAALIGAETVVADEQGWVVSDDPRLRFLDRLDAYLWARHIDAALVANQMDWQRHGFDLWENAGEFGVQGPLIDLGVRF